MLLQRRHLLGTMASLAALALRPRPAFVQTTVVYRRTAPVADSNGLAVAMAAAEPGDDITLAPGVYGGDFTIARGGTATQPIRIRSADPHQARLTGRLLLAGDHITAEYLEWHGTPTEGDSIIEVTGRHCRVTRCRFIDVGVWNGAQRGIVRIGRPGDSRADHVEVSYNYFKNFTQRGICVNEHDPGSRFAWIFRNHFDTNTLGDGKDGIAIGIGGGAGGHADVLRDLAAVVEHNLLEEIGGGMGNSLQAKCSGNIFRFNTIRNVSARTARLEIRAGRNCQVIGNAILGSGGPVVFGDDHLVVGNYNDGGKNGNWIDMGPMAGNSSLDDAAGMADGRQPAARNCLFIGNSGILRLGGGARDWSLPAAGSIIEGHRGEIVEQHAVGTVHRPPTVAVPGYVVLRPNDVGPAAG